MKTLGHLLKWDLIQLMRYQLVGISLLLAAFYLGLLFLLKDLGNLDNLTILLIFNDPVITGYIYAGVLWLFEKNQNTLVALAVSPVDPFYYLLAKLTAMVLLSLGVALVMIWAAYGWHFNYFHFLASVILTTATFCCVGYIVAMGASDFNLFMSRSLLFILPNAIPFLQLFEVLQSPLMYLIPSYGGIVLMKAAMDSVPSGEIAWAYGMSLLFLGLFLALTLRSIKKNMK